MEESSEKVSWQTIWTGFVGAWKVLCEYHKTQANDVGKAVDQGQLQKGEAMMELGVLREEMRVCRGCK